MVKSVYQYHKIFYTRDGVRQTYFSELDGMVMRMSEMIIAHSLMKKLVCVKAAMP